MAKARRIVADRLEAAVEDVVVLPECRLGVAGVPGACSPGRTLARLAAEPSPTKSPGLAAELVHEQDGATYPFGAHVSVVEVEPPPARCGWCGTSPSTTAGWC